MIPLFKQYPILKDVIPHQSLGLFPTPVEPCERLGKELGIQNLFIKRDDLSGEIYGGNKVRKLEFLLADALSRHAKEVLTFGCVGSNHATATAVYANRLGLKSALVLLPQPKTRAARTNLLMDHLNGARLYFCSHEEEVSRLVAEVMEKSAAEHGMKPTVIPVGGSSPVGALGFVNAAFELGEQIRSGEVNEPDVIYVAIGTMGSTVGLQIGLALQKLKTQVIPIRIVPENFANPQDMQRLFTDTLTLLKDKGVEVEKAEGAIDKLVIRDDFYGSEYALFTQEGVEAMRLANQLAGLKLDGTYTGKALAALIADGRKGELKNKDVLFWNTYNSRNLQPHVISLDYHKLPQDFYSYFEETAQPLDKEVLE